LDLGTWNPNQSKQVREILSHATASERRKYILLSGGAGFALAVGSGVVMAPILGMAMYTELKPFTLSQWLIAGSGAAFGVILVIGLVIMVRRAARNVLVNFEWAKEQGITKESLKLDRWR